MHSRLSEKHDQAAKDDKEDERKVQQHDEIGSKLEEHPSIPVRYLAGECA